MQATLIFKALIDPSISHAEPISINNVLKEYDGMKEEIKNLKTFNLKSFLLNSGQFIEDFNLLIKQCYHIV